MKPLESNPEDGSPAVVLEAAEVSLTRLLTKLGLTTLLVVTAIFIAHATPLRDALTDAHAWKLRLAEAGPAGVLWFAGGALIAVSFGFPRLFMTALAGALFGFKVGLPVALFSSTVGAWANFALVRWGARESFRRWIRLPGRLEPLFRHPGFIAVVLLRQLPLWGFAVNASLALTGIQHRVFMAGTLVGTLPSALIVSLIGSGLGKTSLSDSLRNVTWAMILLTLCAGGLWKWRKEHHRSSCVPSEPSAREVVP